MKADSGNNAVLLDTNILIYAEQQREARHEEAKSLRDRALQGELNACVSPQVLSEFFFVMTNTGRRGPEKPLSSQEATDLIRRYFESDALSVIYPGPETIRHLLTLLEHRPITGPNFYDVFLAATMLENDITEIATYNEQDFVLLPGITVVAPADLIPVAGPEDENSSDESELPR